MLDVEDVRDVECVILFFHRAMLSFEVKNKELEVFFCPKREQTFNSKVYTVWEW